MTIAAWWPGEYSTPDADQALTELKEDGPNWLALIVTRYQDTYDVHHDLFCSRNSHR